MNNSMWQRILDKALDIHRHAVAKYKVVFLHTDGVILSDSYDTFMMLMIAVNDFFFFGFNKFTRKLILYKVRVCNSFVFENKRKKQFQIVCGNSGLDQ